MRERQRGYEDLNKSSSARPGGSQQLEIPPSLNSKRATSFFQTCWFFTRRGDFNARQDPIVRLFFCKVPIFCKSALFSGKRQYFLNPPNFCKSAKISQIRLIFVKAPVFHISAWFFKKRKDFVNLLDFSWLQIFVYIFSILFLNLYQVCANINWCNCFNLRFKIDIVVMIIWSIVIIINFVLTL